MLTHDERQLLRALVVSPDPELYTHIAACLEGGPQVATWRPPEGPEVAPEDDADLWVIDLRAPNDHLWAWVTEARARDRGWVAWVAFDLPEVVRRAEQAGSVELLCDAAPAVETRQRIRMAAERDHRRRRLHAEHAQMSEAQDLAQSGSWHFDLERREVTVSAQAGRILGLGQAARTLTLDRFLAHFEEADAERAEAWAEACVESSRPSQQQHVVTHPTRGERILLLRARSLGEQGHPNGLSGVVVDVTDQQRERDKLMFEAQHDALTGLANRREFEGRVERAIRRAEDDPRPFAVVFLDIDGFKKVNESLGHRAGDALLEHLGHLLAKAAHSALSHCDRQSAFLARIGGDEFALLLTGLDSGNQAVDAGRTVLRELEAPFEFDQQELYVTASVGIALHPADHLDAASLLKGAETAMYHAKKLGRGSLQMYSTSMNSMALRRLHLENGLRRALERGELQLYYQPKNDARTRRIVGFEALLRWEHPTEGMISPAQFIPLAEETDLILPIGEWALATACEQAQEWAEMGFADLTIAVNLSPRQFRQVDLAERLLRIVEASGLPVGQLELELTESSLMHSRETAVKVLRNLHDAGIRLAIDDFGTGHSSLAYLKDFPIDVLKIDRAFVKGCLTDPGAACLTRAILGIAQGLHLDVVAEGVETEEQFEFLRKEACPKVQGFLFSTPRPAAEITEMLQAAESVPVLPLS